MKSHEGRVAVVTGAAQGIGQEIAVQMADRGAHLYLLDIADCGATLDRISAAGGSAAYERVDVTSGQHWASASARIEQERGHVDILVNNAGIYPTASFDTITLEDWNRVLQVNLTSQFLSVQALLPAMRRNGWGRIVNITSSTVATVWPGMSHYMASKMGVIGFTRGLANDLGGEGITVNAVAPAFTRTPTNADVPQEIVEMIAQSQAVKSTAYPVDVVAPVLFLTTDEARFITGQTICADGGMTKF